MCHTSVFRYDQLGKLEQLAREEAGVKPYFVALCVLGFTARRRVVTSCSAGVCCYLVAAGIHWEVLYAEDPVVCEVVR